jgi:hypothetical protein
MENVIARACRAGAITWVASERGVNERVGDKEKEYSVCCKHVVYYTHKVGENSVC